MKILIEESVLRQAIEALENFQRAELYDSDAWAAITALRSALDAAEKVEEQLATVTKERDELVAAIEITLDENGHLADGDNCTLIALKRALAKVGADKEK